MEKPAFRQDCQVMAASRAAETLLGRLPLVNILNHALPMHDTMIVASGCGLRHSVPTPGPGASLEEHIVAFVYRPVESAAGHVSGLFVEGYDRTEWARA